MRQRVALSAAILLSKIWRISPVATGVRQVQH
jgi:hypothetical protein